MPTRNINLAEQQKLALLRVLAAEGFDQLDQGEGIALDGAQRLSAYIGRLGKRAAAGIKSRSND